MRSILVMLLILLAGCSVFPSRPSGATFLLVRHAEKSTADPGDPVLTEAGLKRADRIAWTLRFEPVRAVYASATRRAQETAAPTAASHELQVTTYDPAVPVADQARRLRAAHAEGTVLVVGHSNTIPALAQALCGCPIAPMADDEYGRRITIRMGADGRATVDDRREP